MEANELLSRLLEEAGAVAFGVVPAAPVEVEEWRRYERWIAEGCHGSMHYLENYPHLRRDPRLLLEEGARSVVSVAFNYRQPNPLKGLVATYALGRDYHKVLRRRLKPVVRAMADEFGGKWRICIDSAPLLERYWAVKAGIGRRSQDHGNVVVPGIGSMVFLAELVTTLSLRKECRVFASPACGRGERDVREETGETVGGMPCPTGAMRHGGTMDARKCINYLTIEAPAELEREENRWIGNARFGCDICLRSAPENRGPCPGVLPEFEPLPGLEAYLRGDSSVPFDLASSPLSRRLRR